MPEFLLVVASPATAAQVFEPPPSDWDVEVRAAPSARDPVPGGRLPAGARRARGRAAAGAVQRIGTSPTLTVLYTPYVPGDGSPIPIRYRVGTSAGEVALAVFDVQGRLVFWDRRDGGGRTVGRGVYFIRLATGRDVAATRKLALAHR